MAHQYVGFSVSRRVTVEAIIEQAAKMLKASHQSLINMQHGKGSVSESYTKWFGAASPARLKRVTDVVGIMDYGLNAGRIKWLGNHPSCNVNTNAAADPPAGGWSLKTIKDSLQTGEFQIGLCDRFFNVLPDNSDVRQSQIGTLIHELSHILGDTIDVGLDHIAGTRLRALPSQQKEMYQAPNALWLAKNHPDWAVDNAENYGFFCSVTYQTPSPNEPVIPNWIGF